MSYIVFIYKIENILRLLLQLFRFPLKAIAYAWIIHNTTKKWLINSCYTYSLNYFAHYYCIEELKMVAQNKLHNQHDLFLICKTRTTYNREILRKKVFQTISKNHNIMMKKKVKLFCPETGFLTKIRSCVRGF